MTEHLLRAQARMPEGHPDRGRLRDRAIERNLPLADRLPRRYAGRGERSDDLAQVAALALVKAVDGFHALAPFISYAIPTVVTAFKGHVRDSAWGRRVARRAANYLSVGQIYLMGNPLLREPLGPEQVKPPVRCSCRPATCRTLAILAPVHPAEPDVGTAGS